jgi:serine protease inhibitor
VKKEDLFVAIGEIDARSVQRAEWYRANAKPAWVRWAALAACVALLVGVFAAAARLKNGRGGETAELVSVRAQYPEPTAKKLSPKQFMESRAHGAWWLDYQKKVKASSAAREGMDGYDAAIMEKLLVSDEENTVCSPLNTYFAFAMLAEVSAGNTRQQILDMLGVSDMDTLRENVHALWEGNYADTPMLTSILANSIWLNNDVQYQDETLNTLAGQYYASSFRGKPGSKEMDEALQAWTDENTGGLLSQYTKDLKLDKNTVLALVSTIYYKASWQSDFGQWNTAKETFHGVKGDTEVDMMHQTESMDVCRTDAFTAVNLYLKDSGEMIFFLPDEGTDVNSLLSDPDVLRAVNFTGGGWDHPLVNLSVPKFRVSAKTDLIETIRALGVTDALNRDTADFTPLTEEAENMRLTEAQHAAMVEIDEKGVTGAAYTEMAVVTEGAVEVPEIIDFVLDRPFMFVITGADGSILFSGVVRNIE